MLPQFLGRKNDFVRSLSRRDAMKMAVCRCILPPPLAHTGPNRFFTSLGECAKNQVNIKGKREEERRNMGIAQPQRQGVIEQFRLHQTDTGSPEVQVALLSQRIEHLTEHFKIHLKDHHSRHGLLKLVGQRRRLLDYLKSSDFERYQSLIHRLGIRK